MSMRLHCSVLAAVLLTAWVSGLRAEQPVQAKMMMAAPGDAPVSTAQMQLHAALSRNVSFMRVVQSEWQKERLPTRADVLANLVDIDALHVIASLDNDVGPDTLTARYRFREKRSLRPYLGAGINRAVYMEHVFAPGEASSHRIRSSIGMATEMGAEWQVREGLSLNAELRWMSLDSGAGLLRTKTGLFETDSASVGLSIDWRF